MCPEVANHTSLFDIEGQRLTHGLVYRGFLGILEANYLTCRGSTSTKGNYQSTIILCPTHSSSLPRHIDKNRQIV